jgi:carboxyl-terminal processing protease
MTWMKDKNYSYTSYLEYELKQFTLEAKKEKYFADLKNQLDQINARIADSKKNELVLYKDEIKILLEEEIVARQHLEKGSIEAGFKYDQDIKKAIEVLHNNAQYRKILNML